MADKHPFGGPERYHMALGIQTMRDPYKEAERRREEKSQMDTEERYAHALAALQEAFDVLGIYETLNELVKIAQLAGDSEAEGPF